MIFAEPAVHNPRLLFPAGFAPARLPSAIVASIRVRSVGRQGEQGVKNREPRKGCDLGLIFSQPADSGAKQ